MTTTHAVPPLVVEDLEAALAALRTRGLRASSARRLVLEALFAAEGPVTAEAVAGGLDGRVPRGDLASVYRNLETLEQIGLVQHVHLGHGPGLYRLAGSEDADYLLCERCTAVRAVDPQELDEVRALLLRSFGFEARFGHFPIGGLCASCRQG